MMRNTSKNGGRNGVRLSVPIAAALKRRLAAHARQTGKTEAEIVRAAVAEYLHSRRPPRKFPAGKSLYDLLKESGILGRSKARYPTDLATNPKHMEGFGRD